MTHDEVLDWARAMVPALAQRAAETERRRELPEATIADALDADLFRMVVPAELGGHGLGLRSLAGSTRILAHGCVSTAWTLSFLVMHNWFVVRAPAALRDEVFAARGFALVPCPLAPTGRALPSTGGFTLTGRWKWATGVQHGDWVMVNAVVELEDGSRQGRFCVVPVDEVEVVDVWHTAGMRGTGSNDVVADGVFVPRERTLTVDELRGDEPPGARLLPDPFVGYPFTPVLALVAAAPALGGAEAALEHFRAYIQDRVLPYSLGDRQAEQPVSQVRLGEALATVRAARLVWDDAIEQLITGQEAGRSPTPAERGRQRLAASHVVRLSLQAVHTITEGAGASVHFVDSPLGRIHRDLVTLKGHVVFDWDRTAQLAGKLEVGLEPGPADML